MNRTVGLWVTGACTFVNAGSTYIQLAILKSVLGTLVGVLLVVVSVAAWYALRQMEESPCA